MNHALVKLVLEELDGFQNSRVGERISPSGTPAELASAVDRDLPDNGEPETEAIKKLIGAVREGLVHSVHPRYFGFVIGGATPTSVAADWLTSIWDQNAQVYGTSPAASIVEEIVSAWVLDLLGLPAKASVGFVTGAQMANFVGLSVARNAVLEAKGWNFSVEGLQSAPHLHVICGEHCHATVLSAVRMMGLGERNVESVQADEQGRIRSSHLGEVLARCGGPTILCLQAGNANSGASDPFVEAIRMARHHGAWVHVDGAFGLWAQASERYRGLTSGVEKADSWAVDAHKWLNVPYDSGMVIVRDAEQHGRLKATHCSYAEPCGPDLRDGSSFAPENSRRARAFVLYAALRNLGRRGVARLVENGCDRAQEFALGLVGIASVVVLNEVVLNQVLFRVEDPRVADPRAFHAAVALRVQESGTCWVGTTEWRGMAALRISISHHRTTAEDVELSVACLEQAILAELDSGQG